jgi:hypothetical protein
MGTQTAGELSKHTLPLNSCQLDRLEAALHLDQQSSEHEPAQAKVDQQRPYSSSRGGNCIAGSLAGGHPGRWQQLLQRKACCVECGCGVARHKQEESEVWGHQVQRALCGPVPLSQVEDLQTNAASVLQHVQGICLIWHCSTSACARNLSDLAL